MNKQGLGRGKYYVLASMPPEISVIDLPSFDFFKDLGKQKEFKTAFSQLLASVLDIENIYKSIEHIIDLSMMHAITLRDKNQWGWSTNSMLSLAEKILLDNKYAENRKTDDFLDDIAKLFNKWIFSVLKKQTVNIQLDEKYLKLVKRIIKNTVCMNKENFSW